MGTGGGKVKVPEFNIAAYHLWLEERAREEKHKQKSHFVTISREFGCDGFQVAEKLCDLFNSKQSSKWIVFTHQMLEKLAEDEQLGSGLIREVNSGRYSFMNWFIDGLVPDYLQSVQSQVFTRIRTLILNLAEKGNCIIVGGGAQIISSELDPEKFNSLHARLYGSFHWRVKSVMEKFGLSQVEAEKMLKERQFQRSKFVEDFTGKSSSEPGLYNLMFNSDRNDSNIIARTMLSYAEHAKFFKS
ncbi:MAG: cytidylate kinase-like family protein [Nitrospinae bacterium]|nr:cytidylate kinase-like family protein [Nitrospinota bacterium]